MNAGVMIEQQKSRKTKNEVGGFFPTTSPTDYWTILCDVTHLHEDKKGNTEKNMIRFKIGRKRGKQVRRRIEKMIENGQTLKVVSK